MNKILIVGGLGYIGSVLYDFLKNNSNFDIQILDNNLYPEIKHENDYICVDITNYDELEKYICKYNIVINLASVVGAQACKNDIDLSAKINCTGIKNISILCDKYNIYLIHFSSCSIYGCQNEIIDENGKLIPIDYYGNLKWAQEKIIEEYCNKNLILRLGTVYGPSPRMRYDLVVNLFVAQAVKNKMITIFGGKQKRPFLNINDICRAVLFFINKKQFGIYNVGGNNHSIIEIANIIKKNIECDIKIYDEIVDNRNYVINNSKILNLGFTFNHTIESTIDYIKKSPSILNFEDDIYYNDKLILLNKKKHDDNIKEIINIKGNVHIDDRGKLSYINNLDFFHKIKRFYQINNFNCDIIRAFHGHMYESKYIYVSTGSAMIICAKIQGEKLIEPKKFYISSTSPSILHIPNGYANGFKALEKNTTIIFYSTSSLSESMIDDIRFEYDYFGKDIWNVENR
jgi:nucleoside-diphosphate-sugar epimerase/dTDP-4-dehydrorhamnose 3,5-epimerase-like enzyme